jgi:hypothetical protein
MSWTARVRHLYGRVFHRDRVDADLDLELQTYFDIQIERRMARGLTREAAQRAVRLELDGIDQVKQRVREARPRFWHRAQNGIRMAGCLPQPPT